MNRIILTFIIALFFVGGYQHETVAQCKQQVVYNCATNNQKAIYLRDFNTKLRKSKPDEESGTKWTVLLNRGTHYRFNLCTTTGFESSVELTLFDSKRKETVNPYIKTKFSSDATTNNRFDFICPKTGTYYVSIRFKEGIESKKACAVGILSFVGKSR